MKRIICLILCLLLCYPFMGCTAKEEALHSPVNFYYRTKTVKYNSDQGVIAPEVRESYGHEEDIAYLMEQYLNGPTGGKCISPFPAGTQVVQVDVMKNKVVIVLTSHISLLSGSELYIACTCLARTLLELTDVKEVQIISKDDLLDGKDSITIGADSFMLSDNFTINP